MTKENKIGIFIQAPPLYLTVQCSIATWISFFAFTIQTGVWGTSLPVTATFPYELMTIRKQDRRWAFLFWREGMVKVATVCTGLVSKRRLYGRLVSEGFLGGSSSPAFDTASSWNELTFFSKCRMVMAASQLVPSSRLVCLRRREPPIPIFLSLASLLVLSQL